MSLANHQIKKDTHTITETVITNILKMLMYRKWLTLDDKGDIKKMVDELLKSRKEEKIYNIKWFRTGTLGCPGILDIEDLKQSLYYLIDKLSIHFNTKINLIYINSNMINYKTFFIKKDDNIIKLNNLAHILNEKHSDILFKPVIMNPEKNNSISIRFKNDIKINNKKDYLVEIFLSGKLNLKGIFPIELMIEHLKILSKYMFDTQYNIIIKQITNHNDILKIISECPDDIIIEY